MSARACKNCGGVAPRKSGLCKPCELEERGGPEAKREYMARIGARGAHAKAARDRKGRGLDSEELPPLDSHEAAKVWLEVIGRAVATGRLAQGAAYPGIRAVEAWLKAHGEQSAAEVKRELQAELERVKSEIRGAGQIRSVK